MRSSELMILARRFSIFHPVHSRGNLDTLPVPPASFSSSKLHVDAFLRKNRGKGKPLTHLVCVTKERKLCPQPPLSHATPHPWARPPHCTPNTNTSYWTEPPTPLTSAPGRAWLKKVWRSSNATANLPHASRSRSRARGRLRQSGSRSSWRGHAFDRLDCDRARLCIF